jgi:hypothetical protein
MLFLVPFSSPSFPDFWRFGADNYRVSFTELLQRHAMALYQFKKHSLFVITGTPLNLAARALVHCEYTTCQNVPLTFPVAVFGALNVGLSFLLFRRIGFARPTALLPMLVYGTGLVIWTFSMFPDTPVFLSLMTNLFLFLFVTDPNVVRWRRLAVVNALAGLAAPQLAFLGLMPALTIARRGEQKSRAAHLARYVALSATVFAVPFLTVLLTTGSARNPTTGGLLLFPAGEFVRWAHPTNLANVRIWLAVLANFVVAGQAGIYFDPSGPMSLTPDRLRDALPAIALGFGGVAAYALWGLRASAWRRLFPGAIEIAAFLALYLVFFVVYSPKEALLFAAPFVLPLWLLLHAPFATLQHEWRWRAVLAVAFVAGAVANGRYLKKMAVPLEGDGRVTNGRIGPASWASAVDAHSRQTDEPRAP